MRGRDGNAAVCKTATTEFDPRAHLHSYKTAHGLCVELCGSGLLAGPRSATPLMPVRFRRPAPDEDGHGYGQRLRTLARMRSMSHPHLCDRGLWAGPWISTPEKRVRVSPVAPHRCRPTVGLRPPTPPIRVRILAPVPIPSLRLWAKIARFQRAVAGSSPAGRTT